MIWENIALGLLGGIARACVGLLKAMRNDVEIVWAYTAVTVIASGLIGAAAGAMFDSDIKMSVVAGYVGTDLLENSYKIVFKK